MEARWGHVASHVARQVSYCRVVAFVLSPSCCRPMWYHVVALLVSCCSWCLVVAFVVSCCRPRVIAMSPSTIQAAAHDACACCKKCSLNQHTLQTLLIKMLSRHISVQLYVWVCINVYFFFFYLFIVVGLLQLKFFIAKSL